MKTFCQRQHTGAAETEPVAPVCWRNSDHEGEHKVKNNFMLVA